MLAVCRPAPKRFRDQPPSRPSRRRRGTPRGGARACL